MKHTLAIDIGGTNFSVALFCGQTLKVSETRATLRDAGPHWMLDQMESILSTWPEVQLDGCGIGFGGPVDFYSQRVIYSTHVRGWNDFDLVGEAKRRFGVPAIMDRDTMVGALGEGFFGAGRGIRPLFYMTLSTGIGGGLLLDNDSLFRGADSFGCELGHHMIVPNGPDCLCGSNGCLERMCCGLWLQRDYGRSAQELLMDPSFTANYVELLARGLKNTIMYLNPGRIVIGGGISKAGDRLFVPLRHELDRQMPPWSKARKEVVPAELGGHSVLWGALKLAEQELYSGC